MDRKTARFGFSCFVLGVLVVIAAMAVRRAYDRRYPEVFLDCVTEGDVHVVFRHRGTRWTVLVPLMPQFNSYAVSTYVWKPELAEGPMGSDVEMTNSEFTELPLPSWVDRTDWESAPGFWGRLFGNRYSSFR